MALIDDAEIGEVEKGLAVTAGTCAVMGTASTMACLAEALGFLLPGSAAIPAVHADRLRAVGVAFALHAGLGLAERSGDAACWHCGARFALDYRIGWKPVDPG